LFNVLGDLDRFLHILDDLHLDWLFNVLDDFDWPVDLLEHLDRLLHLPEDLDGFLHFPDHLHLSYHFNFPDHFFDDLYLLDHLLDHLDFLDDFDDLDVFKRGIHALLIILDRRARRFKLVHVPPLCKGCHGRPTRPTRNPRRLDTLLVALRIIIVRDRQHGMEVFARLGGCHHPDAHTRVLVVVCIRFRLRTRLRGTVVNVGFGIVSELAGRGERARHAAVAQGHVSTAILGEIGRPERRATQRGREDRVVRMSGERSLDPRLDVFGREMLHGRIGMLDGLGRHV
jgi:hypothetical protein